MQMHRTNAVRPGGNPPPTRCWREDVSTGEMKELTKDEYRALEEYQARGANS